MVIKRNTPYFFELFSETVWDILMRLGMPLHHVRSHKSLPEICKILPSNGKRGRKSAGNLIPVIFIQYLLHWKEMKKTWKLL